MFLSLFFFDVQCIVFIVFVYFDDVEIFCFGLLFKFCCEGWCIVMVVVMCGENGVDVVFWDRMNEVCCVVESIGVELIFGDFLDGFVMVLGDLVYWIEGLM